MLCLKVFKDLHDCCTIQDLLQLMSMSSVISLSVSRKAKRTLGNYLRVKRHVSRTACVLSTKLAYGNDA